jgi:hypothetical protein
VPFKTVCLVSKGICWRRARGSTIATVRRLALMMDYAHERRGNLGGRPRLRGAVTPAYGVCECAASYEAFFREGECLASRDDYMIDQADLHEFQSFL